MNQHDRAGFTLVELLIVIAVIAVLSIVTIFVINPASIFQKSRDTTRINDFANINLSLASIPNTPANVGLFGTPNIIYVSIPDPLATSTVGDQCQGLGLPALPSNYSYHCSASSTYRNANGTGWIPVNFNNIPGATFLGSLPVDPLNQTSTGYYYTYATAGGQYQLYTHFESTANQPQEAATGGYDYASYKVGSNVNIAPFAGGMIAYWPFDEGSGNTTADVSGNNKTGTLNGGVSWVTGKFNDALSFDGSSGYVHISSDFIGTNPFTLIFWADIGSSGNWSGTILSNTYTVCAIGASYWIPNMTFYCSNDTVTTRATMGWGALASYLNQWIQLAAVRNSNGNYTLYLNGTRVGAANQSGGPLTATNFINIGCRLAGGVECFNGVLDDVSLYNHALTDAEVSAIYNAHK